MPPIPPWAATLRRLTRVAPVVTLLALALLALAPQGASLADTARPTAARTGGPTVDLMDFDATCDGRTSDRQAFSDALSYLQSQGGGTLELPAATCLVKQNHLTPTLVVPPNVTIHGQGRKSRVLLDCLDPADYVEMFRIGGQHIALEDFDIKRVRFCTGVVLNVWSIDGLTLDHLGIDGGAYRPGATLHGINLDGVDGGISNLLLDHVTMRHLDYGLFQDSSRTTPTTDLTVRDSRFFGNRADDLEFNGPSDLMARISVTNSRFRANKSTAESAGFGVGLANAHHVLVKGNTFVGYRFEPVHIEDRSSDITVTGNSFKGAFTAPYAWASDVFVVNDVHGVTVTNNVFDASRNHNAFQAVFAGPGGVGYPPPTGVTVKDNRLRARANATMAHADAGAQMKVVDNTVTHLG